MTATENKHKYMKFVNLKKPYTLKSMCACHTIRLGTIDTKNTSKTVCKIPAAKQSLLKIKTLVLVWAKTVIFYEVNL